MRRLLTTAEVAAKLGYSRDRFYVLRVALMQRGFPAPVCGYKKWQQARYDDAAIDAWLDLQMDPVLRAEKSAVKHRVASVSKDWGAILEHRLEQTA